VRQGKTLLTVRAEDDASAERVASIMDDCGAVDIEGDADRDRTGRPAELGGEPDSRSAVMSERRTFSNDEADQPGSPRVARAADLDRDIDFQ
jgi:hypothetical protein